MKRQRPAAGFGPGLDAGFPTPSCSTNNGHRIRFVGRMIKTIKSGGTLWRT
jgi:hypothetical protein